MANYLLIQSRDPFENGEVVRDFELASSLAKGGNRVTLFLVQNGVLPARQRARSTLKNVVSDGVEVLTDSFSLRERGIAESDLLDGVKAADLDIVVDQLAEGRKAIWF